MGELTRIGTIGDRRMPPRLRAAVERRRKMTPEERRAEDEAEQRKDRLLNRELYRHAALDNSGLEGAMLDRRLVVLPTDSPSQRKAVEAAQGFVAAFPDVDGKGFALWGEPGRRKSSIMAAVVHAILTSKPRLYNCLFLLCQEIEEIRQVRDLGVCIANADLVILDDIEKAMDDPGAKWQSPTDKIVRGIINRVDRVKRPILCVTSNKSPEQHKRLGTQWASRLVGLCHWQEVAGGVDLRGTEEEKGNWWTFDE